MQPMAATTTVTAAVQTSGTLIFSNGPSRNATARLPQKMGISGTPPADLSSLSQNPCRLDTGDGLVMTGICGGVST
jgi:hypothetical protein